MRPLSRLCALCASIPLALTACSDSFLSAQAPDADGPDPAQTVDEEATAEVRGRVATVVGAPLAGALVQLGDSVVRSDDDGRFSFGDVLPATVDVWADKDGWTTGHRRLTLEENGDYEVAVNLLPTRTTTLPDARRGGRVSGDDGVALEFPPLSFESRPGVPYEGPLVVEYALLRTAESILAAPGEMKARVGAIETPLESHGMVEVEFATPAGLPLEFVGESARLEIPTPETTVVDDGAVLPMWTFDEEEGLWLREGSAVLRDGVAYADVPHFSWWNCDQPMNTSCVTGRLVDPITGDGVDSVSVQTVGLDYRGSYTTSTTAEGDFCADARIASTAELDAFGVDGTIRIASFETPATQGTCGSPAACLDMGDVPLIPAADDDGDGYNELEGDCDDEDPTRHPAAVELCDGADQDCTGVADDDPTDADGDESTLCFDCDDDAAAVHPGAYDVCDEHADNDCDGEVDDSELDGDGDGVTRCDGDCDDDDPARVDRCTFSGLAVASAHACALGSGGPICWGTNARVAPEPVAPPVGIYAGHSTTCTITVGAGAHCWGDTVVTLPTMVTLPGEFDALAIGDTHVCGLRPGGEVGCWGSAADGRTIPAEGLFEAVAAGPDHTCAARVDGEVFCWGGGFAGVEHVGSVAGLVSLAVIDGGGCGLDEFGRAQCWGTLPPPTNDPDAIRFEELTAGRDHVCGRTEASTIACWGANGSGQADAPDGRFVAVDAGGDVTCGVRDGGAIECWGADEYGKLDAP